MNPIYYFAYGANANVRDMAIRCPSAQWVGTATLPDHVLRFRLHADVEPCEGRSVYGVLWIVDDAAVATMDQYEGYPHYYDRKVVRVWQDGEPITAMIYQMVDQTYQDLPQRSYISRIRDGYDQCGVPTQQLDQALANVELDPQWDPIFRRIKPTAERQFGEAIRRDEYYDLE